MCFISVYSVLNTLSEYTYFYISKNITSYTFLLVFKIVESRQCILKDLPVHEIKAKYITCSFDMPMGVLLQIKSFDLDINMTPDIKEKATNPENGFNYLLKMAKTENILPTPRLVSFSFDFR